VSSRADIDDLLVVGLPGAVGAIAFGYVLHDLTSDLKAEADRMVKRLGAATNAKLRAQLDQEQSWQVLMWPYRLGAHLLRQHHEAGDPAIPGDPSGFDEPYPAPRMGQVLRRWLPVPVVAAPLGANRQAARRTAERYKTD